jgi:hypothetical protein
MTSGVIYENLLAGETYAATKVKVLSPEMKFSEKGPSFQVGLDFTPNSEHKGDALMANNRSQSFASQGSIFGNNMISYSVKATQELDKDLNVSLAFSGLRGESRDGRKTAHLGNFRDGGASSHNLKDYKSYNVGGLIEYKDTQFAAGFQDNCRSGVQKHDVSIDPSNVNYEQFSYGNAGKGYDVAVAQTYGETEMSVAYLHTTKKHAKAQKGQGHIISGNLGHKLADGLHLVGGVSYLKQTTSRAAILASEYEGGKDINPNEFDKLLINNNKGYVGTVGLSVKF